MGQKVNPIGFRMGISRDWTAKWYAGTKTYTQNLISDIALRDYIKARLKNAAVSTIVIERPAQSIRITVHTARPGIVIGKKGEDIEKLRQELTKLAGRPVQLAVEEVRQPELDAQLVSENVAQQLEKRIMFRRAMKRAVTNAMRLRALGIKIMVAGRLNGSEIARTEWYREGRVPLHTLRADIDYGFSEAHTTYGKIGVKVWIFKGEVFDKDTPKMEDAEAQKKGAAV
ncbi:MAG: 30S ribosomal protein S3 [Candidatus Muproteobacteria bacterium RIFCSPHIGHO2_12_FULL_60_33]|uniref:Small ribosomal subunit protein uS3 n=2 Tax=Pseudomonadota TaxID=1224 RepID=A0A0H4T3G5_9PROT|nr:30S ribosomal protein S3, small subunit ribosomal protein S3 [uncultured proteobacterium Rifle_16ft_4_minimus_1560]OGI49952.1 MAG: 30S ribosomal protein S3 [Candidatus Muproteobacteria bacterium RIFCSPHIGHO2_01_60_12]OGI51435.1 MAG: 30S ribosomal protein S3 [Candidatus Muproteobacteria bacterium RIFCSPLOWO2_01_FULL_60_18]OGI54791.1 MAG: 30S ribosomal protein S3 [Candidatus Muproteobacteria bacterium RIFCSPHIGHO2_12_FULL_60_33]OGI58187.1 MAG: 30S ribosomal protein S3 [Candidatus Muproteobacte